jgi:hypothetical protein
VFQTKVVREETHFEPNNFFPEKMPLLIYREKTWWSQIGNKWQYNTPHAYYMLDT